MQAVVGNKWIERLLSFQLLACFSAGGSSFLPDIIKNKTDYLEAGDRRIISIRVRGRHPFSIEADVRHAVTCLDQSPCHFSFSKTIIAALI